MRLGWFALCSLTVACLPQQAPPDLDPDGTEPEAPTDEPEPVDEDGDGVPVDEDCDDADPDAYPGAPELCDGWQNDCDARWTSDAGTATWFGPNGAPTSLTDALAEGTRQRAAEVTLDKRGTLVLCEGTWYAELVVEGEEVTVQGADGVVLAGDGDGSVITVATGGASVVLEDLVVTGGGGPYGAGLDTPVASPVHVTLRRTTFRGNVAEGVDPEGYGGGVYVFGDLTIESSSFLDNRAVVGGAAVVDGGELRVTGATFAGNRADLAGAVLVLGGTVDLSEATFTGNGATTGGQLYLQASSGTGAEVVIEDGADADHGGGLLMDASELTLTDSVVHRNTARIAGGGLYLLESELTLVDSAVDDNVSVSYVGSSIDTSVGAGGGAYTIDSTVTCRGDGGFGGNAAVWGPAVFAELATGSGGALVSDGCDWTSSESSLAGSSSVLTDEVHLFVGGAVEHMDRFGANARFTCDVGGCR
jgi:hypothetical protein